MKKGLLHINKGFSLVEILVSISIFLVFVIMLGDITVNSIQQSKNAGNRERAVALADEGLEAVRNIRDINFTSLVDGTYGLATTSNKWNLSGSFDVTDIFTRKITVSTMNSTQKKVDTVVTWADQSSTTNTVAVSSYLTDWRKSCNQSTSLTVNTAGALLTNSNRRLNINLGSTDCNIVIDKISLNWTNSGRRLSQITIGGTSLWTGSASSNAVNDVTNYTINQGQTGVVSVYIFNGSMTRNTFSLTFTMLDGTTKTVSGIAL